MDKLQKTRIKEFLKNHRGISTPKKSDIEQFALSAINDRMREQEKPKNALKPFDKISVQVYRYFSRTTGATVYTVHVSVLLDYEFVASHKTEIMYGQSTSWETDTYNILCNLGYYERNTESLSSGANKGWYEYRSDLVDFRHKFSFSVVDVEKKRYL